MVTPGFDERPPLVPPRRESITNLPVKPIVPIHLVSTTNQSHKASSVQQKIPTKLAAQPKGKEKHSKPRNSHQRTKSSGMNSITLVCELMLFCGQWWRAIFFTLLAGIEVSQLLPIKVSGKEGGSLRAMRSNSPHRLHPGETSWFCVSP